MIKIYKGIGKGENLWDALTDSRGGYEHKSIYDWVEGQQEAYIASDWDNERISELIWELRDETIFDVLKKIKVKSKDINLDQCYDRKWLKGLLKKRLNKVEKEAVKELIKDFKDDLGKKRLEWANEKAWDDFNIFSDDIDKKDDDEVAEFLGIEFEIEGVEIDGTECLLNQVEFCRFCGEAMLMECMEEIYDDHFMVSGGFKESNFYCSECSTFYKYDKKHCEINKHVSEVEIMTRLV